MGGERVSLQWTKRKNALPGGHGGALRGFLKSENRPNPEGIAPQRAKNSLDFECRRQELSASRPPDLLSDDGLFFAEREILAHLLISSFDQLK